MSQSRHVLLIGGGSELQPLLRRTVPNARTTVICRATVLPWVHELAENQAVIVLNDDTPLARWLSAARRVHEECRVQHIGALAEIDQDKAAAIAADLSLHFHSPQTVDSVFDKVRMRQVLAEARIDQVPFREVPDIESLRAFAEEVGPPLIVKPTSGRASAGVGIIRTVEDVPGAFERANGATAPRLAYSPPMVERFVDGREFSVEALTAGGHHHIIAITEKFSDEQTRIELGHLIPARITKREESALLDCVRRALTALQIHLGVTHTEVILGRDGPMIVETHLREAGDDIIEMALDATGVDVSKLLVRQVAGLDVAGDPELTLVRERPRYRAAAAIAYLAPCRTGVLETISGLPEAEAIEHVVAVEQLVDDGGELPGMLSSYSRLASVRTQGPTAEQALAAARAALGRLSVEIRPVR